MYLVVLVTIKLHAEVISEQEKESCTASLHVPTYAATQKHECCSQYACVSVCLGGYEFGSV